MKMLNLINTQCNRAVCTHGQAHTHGHMIHIFMYTCTYKQKCGLTRSDRTPRSPFYSECRINLLRWEAVRFCPGWSLFLSHFAYFLWTNNCSHPLIPFDTDCVGFEFLAHKECSIQSLSIPVCEANVNTHSALLFFIVVTKYLARRHRREETFVFACVSRAGRPVVRVQCCGSRKLLTYIWADQETESGTANLTAWHFL